MYSSKHYGGKSFYDGPDKIWADSVYIAGFLWFPPLGWTWAWACIFVLHSAGVLGWLIGLLVKRSLSRYLNCIRNRCLMARWVTLTVERLNSTNLALVLIETLICSGSLSTCAVWLVIYFLKSQIFFSVIVEFLFRCLLQDWHTLMMCDK